jgi:hypothetical protein
MQNPTRRQRITAQIDALPEFWRPVAYGACLLLIWMGMRGALIIPVAVIVLFATSETPLADLGTFAVVVAFAIVGGALSGLAYSVLGRHVLKLKGIGRYLAGIITLAPYMFVMVHVIGFTDGEHFLRRPSTAVRLVHESVKAR